MPFFRTWRRVNVRVSFLRPCTNLWRRHRGKKRNEQRRQHVSVSQIGDSDWAQHSRPALPSVLGQEQSASSSASRKMRFRFSSRARRFPGWKLELLPEYPKAAIDKNIEGTVILHVVVSDDGTVMQAEATFGPSDLTKSAIDAVKQWRFEKTLQNQQPVEVDTTLALVYALRPTPAVSVNKDYKPTPPSSTSNTQSPPNKGVIEGTTYKNSSIGIQFTSAPGLRLEQMNAAASNMIAVQAQNDPGPMYGLTVPTPTNWRRLSGRAADDLLPDIWGK